MNHFMLSERHTEWLTTLGIDPNRIDIPLLSSPQYPEQIESWLKKTSDILKGSILPSRIPVGDCLLFPIDDSIVTFWGWDGSSRQAVLVGLDFSVPLFHHSGNSQQSLWITGNPLRALIKIAQGNSVIGVPSPSSLAYWPKEHRNTNSVCVAVTEQTLIRRLKEMNRFSLQLDWSQKDPVRHLDGLVVYNRTMDRIAKFGDFKSWANRSFQESPSEIGIQNWRGMIAVFAAELGRWFREGGWDMSESLNSWWQEGHMGSFAGKSITIHDPASRKKKRAYVFESLVASGDLCKDIHNVG
jgi:hypothetical protein